MHLSSSYWYVSNLVVSLVTAALLAIPTLVGLNREAAKNWSRGDLFKPYLLAAAVFGIAMTISLFNDGSFMARVFWASVGLAGILLLTVPHLNKAPASRKRNVINGVTCSIVLAGIVAALWWTSSFSNLGTYDDKRVVIYSGKTVVAQHPFGFWRARVSDLHAASLLLTAKQDLGFDNITSNPKVRHLTYRISLETPPDPRMPIRREEILNGRSLSLWLESEMIEFNEVYSRETAKLYNPLDHNQQKRFARMVNGYFTNPSDPFRHGPPPLAEGWAHVSSASFDIRTSGE